ncbi:MAG: MOSC domain-containing protein [Geminicoccaceae bacterium]|jgi:uncharacterized protein YcbX|nr:MAG: MOSC domain-containing protein [Geminicoccaceae bacterium]
MGLAQDRRWMLVRPDGRFLTQREEPQLARLVPRLEPDRLVLSFEGAELALPLDDRGASIEVVVWADRIEARAPDPEADGLLSRWLGRPVRVVRFPDTAHRPCDPAFTPAGARTAFSDGFPLLVTSATSLAALNAVITARGGSAVPMARFRPNVVLDGLTAWAEDRTRGLVLASGASLLLVKPCARCIVTTTDQETGERLGTEPIRSLQSLDRDLAGEGPCFGWNAVPRLPVGPIRLRVGDPVALAA